MNKVNGSAQQRSALTAGKALARRIEAELQRQPGLGECLQLCDATEIEHVCELVAGEFELVRLGYRGQLPALETHMVAPLRRFLDTLSVPNLGRRMELAPTVDLIDAANTVLRALDARQTDPSEAARLTTALRIAWFVWLGYVATYWLTFRAPQLLVQKQVNRELGRMGGKTPKTGLQRSTELAEKIVAEYRRLLQTHERKDVAAILEEKGICSAAYARRVWRLRGNDEPVPHEKANLKAGV